MLDNKMEINKEEAKVYPPLPENIYQVELLDINAKEVETYNSKMGKTDSKEMETIMSFQFTLLNGLDKGEELRGRNVWGNFVPAVLFVGKKGKNALYRITEAMLGRELTPQEEAEGISGAFLNDLVGKQCRIGTKHVTAKGDVTKVYDNIATYYPAEVDLKALTTEEKDDARVKTKEEKEAGKTGTTADDDKAIEDAWGDDKKEEVIA